LTVERFLGILAVLKTSLEYREPEGLARIIHEEFCCNRQLHAISNRAHSLLFDVLQVRLQSTSLCLA